MGDQLSNRYWDVDECRWVDYRGADDAERAPGVPSPRAGGTAGTSTAGHRPAAASAEAAG